MEQNIIQKAEASIAAATEPKKSKGLLNSGWWPLLYFVLFAVVFFGVYAYLAPVAKDIQNDAILSIFVKFSKFTGAVFGLLSMLAAYILYGIRKLIVKSKFSFINPIIMATVTLPWFLLGRELIYFEKRYTDIGRGAIDFLGQPLYYTALVFFGLATVWFLAAVIFSFKKSK